MKGLKSTQEQNLGWGNYCMAGLLRFVANRGEAFEGFICDSVTVVLPLQKPDLETREYVCTFLLETTYT